MLKRGIHIILLTALMLLTSALWTVSEAAENVQPELINQALTCTIELEMSGTIGPASVDLLERGIRYTLSQKCSSLLLLINTPGGNLQSTRLIVEAILNAPIPILCLVYPTGGHAGSAGAIIHQACHVNGAMVGTNLGAATPVMGGGQEMPEDLRKKMLNDARSWMESITQLRGRSEEFGKDIILEAKAVGAEEALKIGAIDFVAETKAEFLDFAQGRKVRMTEKTEAEVQVGPLIVMELDYRHRVVAFFTDPQIAYLLFMGSLALLYYEVTNPGTMVAGVVGGVGLVLSLVAMHKLDVRWGGLLLLLLGVALIIAEVFVPSFGILGIGGVVSFVMGSLFLYDPSVTGGYALPLETIIPVSLALALAMLGLTFLAVKSTKVKKRGSFDDMIGMVGEVAELTEPNKGLVNVNGEIWSFKSSHSVSVGEEVKVLSYQGLTLNVQPNKEKAQ